MDSMIDEEIDVERMRLADRVAQAALRVRRLENDGHTARLHKETGTVNPVIGNADWEFDKALRQYESQLRRTR